MLDLSSSEDEIEQDENQQVIKPKKETKIKEPKEEKTIDFEKFNNELESIYENFKETKEDKNKNQVPLVSSFYTGSFIIIILFITQLDSVFYFFR